MVIVPKKKPVVEGLNSYYLDIPKLVEHYQGELGTGSVCFHSVPAEGAVFFDEDDLLNGVLIDRKKETIGKAAVKRLMSGTVDHNFTVGVYKLEQDSIYYWANIPFAEHLYRDLSTQFTDLEGLIDKMRSEKMSGYIEIAVVNSGGRGVLFFNYGKILAGSYSWIKGEISEAIENQEILIQKAKELGAEFHVSKIPQATEAQRDPTLDGRDYSARVINMLGELLYLLEKTVTSNKRIKAEFSTLLKKKLIAKAEKYGFLDPFAGEFAYSEKKVTVRGNASEKELTTGIVESVKELADELGIRPQIADQMTLWSERYAQVLATMKSRS